MKFLPTPLLPPVIACFPSPESRNLNDLVLISSCLARATRAGAVGSARPQASSVAAARGATLATACCLRPRGASWDRPRLGAHGRGLPAGPEHRSGGDWARRDRTCRGRARRRAGAGPIARRPAPRTSGEADQENYVKSLSNTPLARRGRGWADLIPPSTCPTLVLPAPEKAWITG